MVRIHVNVSILPEQAEFIEKNQINMSQLLQSEINKLMETKLSPEFLKQLMLEKENLQNNLDKWKEMFYNSKAFIESRGFADEFNKQLMD